MSSCMKLHKQPQPFPKAGVKRSPSITQAGTERGPSPKQEVKDFTQVDAFPSNQAYIQFLFQQTLFCSAFPHVFLILSVHLDLGLFQGFTCSRHPFRIITSSPRRCHHWLLAPTTAKGPW